MEFPITSALFKVKIPVSEGYAKIPDRFFKCESPKRHF